MEKKIEFDANMRVGMRHSIGWLLVPNDLYMRIPTHLVDGQRESIERFHVTLSPVEDPERNRRVQSQEPEGSLKCPWVRVKTVKSGICIVCHKKLLYHNLSELGDCRRDARRKFDKLEHGLREIQAHIETVIDIEVKKIEANRKEVTSEHEEYKKITAEFNDRLAKELKAVTILTKGGELDFVHSYHYVHRVKQLADNALTELENLK